MSDKDATDRLTLKATLVGLKRDEAERRHHEHYATTTSEEDRLQREHAGVAQPKAQAAGGATVAGYNESMRTRGLPDSPHEFEPQEYAREFCGYQPSPESPRCNLSRLNVKAHEQPTPETGEEWRVERDGCSRPIIFTSDGRWLSVSQWEYGRWVSYEQEEADCAAICAALNAIGRERVE